MSKLTNHRLFKPLAVTTGAALVLLGASSTVAAANNSVPGDKLYGLDTALESLQVATSLSDTSKAATHLTIAEEKLVELQVLNANAQSEDKIAKAAEQLAKHQDGAGVDVAKAQGEGKDVEKIIERLRTNAARQQSVLQGVIEKAPEQAQDALAKAMEASSKGLQNAQQQQTKAKGSDAANGLNSHSAAGLENKKPE